MDITEVRQEVKDFALLMEKVLRENDYKVSYKDTLISDLIFSLEGNIEEIRYYLDALAIDTVVYSMGKRNLRDRKYHLEILTKSCIDVANYAMMIHAKLTAYKYKEN